MLIEDWRATPPHEACSLLDREASRWRSRLAWDPSEAWTLVEQARSAGTVPGFVARDGPRIVGWTFFVVHDGVLKIGALDGATAEVVRALLEAVLAAPETRFASDYQCFVFPGHPSVEAALARRRFTLERHVYLDRTLSTAAAAPWPMIGPRVRPWRPSDLPGLVRLFARAYAHDALARCFAPHGRTDEWAGYVSQLVQGPALGRFAPECSWVGADGSATHPHGGLLTTWIAPGVLHVAQVAVDPDARGRGIARALMEAALTSAADQGGERVTLLVAASNAAALALYRALEFTERDIFFLFGWRERPTRVLRARLSHRAAAAPLQQAG